MEEHNTCSFGFHIDLEKREEYADSLDMQKENGKKTINLLIENIIVGSIMR